MKVFVAGSGQDRINVAYVAKCLKGHGYEVFDWWSSDEWESDEPFDRVAVARADLRALDESDVMVWVLSDKPSQGAPFEAGYATAKGKPVLVLDYTSVTLLNRRNDIYPALSEYEYVSATSLVGLLGVLRVAAALAK